MRCARVVTSERERKRTTHFDVASDARFRFPANKANSSLFSACTYDLTLTREIQFNIPQLAPSYYRDRALHKQTTRAHVPAEGLWPLS